MRKLDQKSLSALDVTVTLRPAKVAFLIDVRTPTQWIIDEVIPWISASWGGALSFFFPVDHSLEDRSPSFPKWLNLLTKFDPDEIVSTAQFSPALLETLSARLLTHAKPFQFATHVTAGGARLVNRGHHYTSPLEHVLAASSPLIALHEYSVQGAPPYPIWFFSLYGRLGRYQGDFQQTNVPLTAHQITSQAIDTNIDDIIAGRYVNFSASPLTNSMIHLGATGALEYFDSHQSPQLVIIGDDLSDWALYQSLRRMYQYVTWYPESLLPATPYAPFAAALAQSIHFNQSSGTVITSATLDSARLNAILNGIQSWYARIGHLAFTVTEDFDTFLSNWLIWGEVNNAKNDVLLFEKDISIQKSLLLAPKNFKLPPDKINFRNDISSSKYRFLKNPLCKTSPVQWPNPRSTLATDSRRDVSGGVSFYALSHLRFAGQDLDSIMRGPHLTRLPLFDDFSAIATALGFHLKRSHRTLNVAAVLALWDDDLESFERDYDLRDSSKIFAAYKARADLNIRKRLGVASSAGILIERLFYFSRPIEQGFTSNLTAFTDVTLDSWLRRDILVRGERLKCPKCGLGAFYPEWIVGKKVQCKRCASPFLRDLASLGSIEPRFLYGQNPLLYGMQENDSDLPVLGAARLKKKANTYFECIFEIELCNDEQRCVQEIDLVANVDGQLFLGEAKTNGRLGGSQLTAYVDLCERSRADGFVCISASPWNPGTVAAITAAFSRLRGFSLEFL